MLNYKHETHAWSHLNLTIANLKCTTLHMCFVFSRWQPSTFLDFWKFEILTACTILRVNMHHCTKFCANQSNHCLKVAAIHRLGFLKFQHFNCRHSSGGQYASPCQFSCESVKLFQDMAIFILQDGGHPHCWICKSLIFYQPALFEGSICVSVSGQTVSKIWLFCIFKMVAVLHLWFV